MPEPQEATHLFIAGDGGGENGTENKRESLKIESDFNFFLQENKSFLGGISYLKPASCKLSKACSRNKCLRKNLPV